MNLLITGGCGFIGSNFINYYYDINLDCKIINIDTLYYCANIENIREDIRKSERYQFIKGNICSYDLIAHILEEYNITHIIHFAAQSHVDNSFHTPLQYTQDNIVGTHTLLEASRKYNNLKLFIHVSTDEVYGESMIRNDELKKTEETILCPTNPYAATKAGAELIVMSYYHSYKMPIIITRGNNVYGPNQYPEKLIPRFIKLLKDNKKLTIHGDGMNLRSFIHTEDVSNAFKIILEKGIIGEIYNIGANEENEYSIIEIAKKIIKNINKTVKYEEYIEYVEDRLFNDKRYYISNKKLKDLGWNMKKNFNNSLYELCEK
jgi:UDP-glucose 4,6-dehydratase